jgi:hypothetical protein
MSIIASSISSYFDAQEREPSLFLSLLVQLLGLLLSIAATYTFLHSVRGKKVKVGEALNIAAQPLLFLKMLAVNILLVIILVLSLLALIVPFFFVLPRVYLAPYFLIDKGLNPLEAIKMSWNETKGHATKVWAILAATIAMALLMLTIIGIPFAIYFLFMYSAASAVTYFFILEQSPLADDQAV